MSKYRDVTRFQAREYKHEATRQNDTYPKWLEKLIESDPTLNHLAKKKSKKGVDEKCLRKKFSC
jgi:hypothetical protein